MYRTTNQQLNDQPWVAQRPAHNLVSQSGTGRTESTGVRQFSGQRPSLAASTRQRARVCAPPTQRRRNTKCFGEGPQTPRLVQTQRYFEGRRNRRTPNATVKRPTGFCAAKDRKHGARKSTCQIQTQPTKISMRPARCCGSATKPRQANGTSRRHLPVKDPETHRRSTGNSNHHKNTGSAYHNNTDIDG